MSLGGYVDVVVVIALFLFDFSAYTILALNAISKKVFIMLFLIYRIINYYKNERFINSY